MFQSREGDISQGLQWSVESSGAENRLQLKFSASVSTITQQSWAAKGEAVTFTVRKLLTELGGCYSSICRCQSHATATLTQPLNQDTAATIHTSSNGTPSPAGSLDSRAPEPPRHGAAASRQEYNQSRHAPWRSEHLEKKGSLSLIHGRE